LFKKRKLSGLFGHMNSNLDIFIMNGSLG